MEMLPIRKTRLITLAVSFVLVCCMAGVFVAGFFLPIVGVFGLASARAVESVEELPEEFTLVSPSQRSVIFAADGTQIAQFFAENRIVVPLSEIALPLQQGTISIEDRRFLYHSGVDIEGIGRAAFSNLTGNDLQGASTLTQQYVKNILIEKGRVAGDSDQIEAASAGNLGRKAREAKYALEVEHKLSKAQILEGYLNIAQFGPSVYGVEAASRHYFSKTAKELSISEAALLAGMPQSPNGHDPVTNPQSAQKRRDAVLDAMHRDGYINEQQLKEAKSLSIADMLKLSDSPQGCALAGNAAYFCSWVVREILTNSEFGDTVASRQRLLLRGGLNIHTTLDINMQNAAFDAITTSVPVADPSNVKMVAVSVEPGTGKIKAMAQNTKFGSEPGNPSVTENNYNADKDHSGGAGFQMGSTFKTFTLAQWYADGRSGYEVIGGRYKIPAREWNIPCNPGLAVEYEFGDVGGRHGPSTVAHGTAQSTNGVFVNMATKLNMCDISNLAASVGLTDPEGNPYSPNPSFILGDKEAPPLNVANAYATLAARGAYCRPIAITAIEDAGGKEIPIPSANCHQAIAPDVADKVNTTLMGVINGGGGSLASIGRPAAGKTGTTNSHAALWFAGFVPQLATAVWAGHSEGNIPMDHQVIGGRYYGAIYGATLAAPTWARYMRTVLANVPVQPITTTALNGKYAPPPPPIQNIAPKTTPENRPAPSTAPKPAPAQPSQPAPAPPPAPAPAPPPPAPQPQPDPLPQPTEG